MESQISTEEIIGKGNPHFLILDNHKNLIRCYKEKKDFEESKKRLEEFKEGTLNLYGEKSVQYAQYYYESGMLEED